MTNETTFEMYKAAADRIRRGQPLIGDNEICERWDARRGDATVVRSVWDLPMARGMFEADRRDGAK